MPGSTLTVRTLALATVALVLACGHAVKAMGNQRAAADRAVARVAPPVAPIRVVPAGSAHSTVATFYNSGARGGGSSSSSKVATFTSRAGGSSNSVVTFGGDRLDKRTSAAAATRRPLPSPRTKPRSGILPPKGDPPVIAVRRSGPIQLDSNGAAPLIGPPTPRSTNISEAATPQKSPGLRNAFGGLNQPPNTTESMASAPLVYARASAR